MVVRAVSVIFLSVYLMAGNHLTVSAANGEKISEDSDFSVSGENMDSLLNSLDLSRIEAFLREAGGSAVPGLSFREILSMLLSGNYQRVVRMLMDFCRTALFREISENGRWMGQVILLGILGAVFASFSSLFADSQVSEMGFYVTYLLIFTLLAASFLNGVRITRTLLEQLFEFVRVLVPAFFLAVSFSGGSTSAAAGYAWTLASVNVAEWVFLRLFLPCTQLYVLLSLAGHLSSKDLFSKALELLEQGMRWGSKALLGVVLGFHVLQGMIAPYRFGAPDGAAAGGQPDTGNRTGRSGSVAGTSWKQRPDSEYGGHRGSACVGGGVASAAFETFNPLSGVPGKRGAFAAGQ